MVYEAHLYAAGYLYDDLLHVRIKSSRTALLLYWYFVQYVYT